MSKRFIKTWEDLYSPDAVDSYVNNYALEHNLIIVSVSLAVGFKYFHVSALFEEYPSEITN